ncbi:MAG: METTL5 family protein [Candidatus Woesearchaeota archaeon]
MGIGIELSKLKVFDSPKVKLEQYPTDPEVAEKIFDFVLLYSDLENAVVADLGCGSGILGIGALLLNAKFVYFLDVDKDALKVLEENLKRYEFINYKIINDSVENFSYKVDLVIMNPPFGTKVEHSDRIFYDVALSVAKEVYSITKTSTEEFLIKYAKQKGFSSKVLLRMKHLIRNQFYFHKSKTKFIDVSLMFFKKLTN